MKKATHFIEIWTAGEEYHVTNILPISMLKEQLDATKEMDMLKTIAIFKIKEKCQPNTAKSKELT